MTCTQSPQISDNCVVNQTQPEDISWNRSNTLYSLENLSFMCPRWYVLRWSRMVREVVPGNDAMIKYVYHCCKANISWWYTNKAPATQAGNWESWFIERQRIQLPPGHVLTWIRWVAYRDPNKLQAVWEAAILKSCDFYAENNWKFCANAENENCNVNGEKLMRYGHGDRWLYQIAINSRKCDQYSMWGDPAYWIWKRCEFLDVPMQWVFCWHENQNCKLSWKSVVRYGKHSTWTYKFFNEAGFDCTNGVFGDPLYGTVKECQVFTPICPN